MIMSGSLAEWSVEDLLHLVRITEKTTSITLTGSPRAGAIHLRDGAMVGVTVDPPIGDAGDDFSRAVDALRALMELSEGSFEFGPLQLPQGPAFDIDHLLAAVHKDVAREQRVRALGITEEQPLALNELPPSAITLQVQAWQLLAPLVPTFRLRDLDRRFGRGRAVATVLMLEALGVLDRGGSPRSGDGVVPSPLEALPATGAGTPAASPPAPLAVGPDASGAGGGEVEERGMEVVDDQLLDPEAPPAARVGDPRSSPTRPAVPGPSTATPPVATPPRRPTVVDPGDTLGAHYVEVFDDPAGAGIVPPAGGPNLTLVPDVLDDLRSRFRTRPSRIDTAVEGELDDD